MAEQPISKVIVAGAGTMGPLLARVLASAGLEVTVWNRGATGLDRARARRVLAEGPPAPDACSGITWTTDTGCFTGAQLVIESIAEQAEAKKAFYRLIGPLLPNNCILVTNTSGLSITDLATAVERPESFCGMHWIYPPHLIPLVEVVSGVETAEETAQTVYHLALRLGKKPIRARDVPGFVLNRLQFAVLREALHLVESGAAGIEDVDGAMRYGLGLRYACLGPFQAADHGGLDVFTNIADYLFADLDNSRSVPEALRRRSAAGQLGVKSGQGFYSYPGEAAVYAVAERDRRLRTLIDALFSGG